MGGGSEDSRGESEICANAADIGPVEVKTVWSVAAFLLVDQCSCAHGMAGS
jgi:hypothetical protein